MAQNGEKSDVAKREEEILQFWQENKIFEKSEQKDAPEGEFVFYDGPPFATGLPHYGHILASAIKDVIPRYKTMRGFRVRRRWGWDCHGLPLENLIEKELGLKNKRDIEELGVEKFNAAARNAVLRYADDWKRIIPRMGRWADMERDYKTMDATYTESVWWVFKSLYEKGLAYEGFKSMHLCPRCGTTLSNFEVAQGYKDIVDFAVTVKLELKDEQGTYLLVWTTTPWTLPGNMAAAVNKDATYVKVDVDGEKLIFAKERLSILEGGYKILEEFSGKELVGKSYTPPFSYFVDKDIKGKEHAWKIYHAPYVSLEEGTGAVHLAPAFGSEDMELAQEYGIPLVHHVNQEGKFTEDVTDFAGMSVKPKDTPEEKDKHQSADIEIIKYLAHKGLLFKKEKITHSYPLCWRCDTPLLNYAASSWFVEVTKIRDAILKENEKVSWVPKEVGEKRFGNWIKNARDWAVSRSRYWGAPLPVWKNEKTGKVHVIGSVEDLKRYTKKSGNMYFLMRHGESKKNVEPQVVTGDPDAPYPLTEYGKQQVHNVVNTTLKEGVDLIVTSPVLRSKETAELTSELLGLDASSVVVDNRLRELEHGSWEGRSLEEYDRTFPIDLRMFDRGPEGGENWTEVRNRVAEVLYELERKYNNKKILIISHGDPMALLAAAARGLSNEGTVAAWNECYPKKGVVNELIFVPIPHNENYELDLHRPYIDQIELVDEDGERLKRIPDVFDCWFESGSMPYGQHHYPFENTDVFEPKSGLFKKSRGYPADFIAEGLDQTRGWFYSLIVLGTALFGKSPYKNVIVNGLVLAEDGQKMSKRLNNYPDPMEVVGKYGADAVRLFMLSSPVVRGEDLNFSEEGVQEIMRKNITRLENVHAFYKLYATGDIKRQAGDSPHVLDSWILARLHELREKETQAMDAYELDRAARPIADFIDDLSTWYLRRSRDRFKSDDAEDKAYALATTRYVLMELAKLMAPFMPFYADLLYRELRSEDEPESVHLCAWPEEGSVDEQVVSLMKVTREVISHALEARASAGIKVRQPLRRLTVKHKEMDDTFAALIRDEVNVKEVVFDESLKDAVELDTHITKELKQEGFARDFIRAVQDLRKRAGLTPDDKINLTVSIEGEGKHILEQFENDIKHTVLAERISFESTEGETLELGEHTLTVSFEKLTANS